MNLVPTHAFEADQTYQPANYKSDIKPVWCPGCGDHAVLLAFQRAMAELALAPEKVAVVSGIGCSSRIPAYTNTYGFHGVHGRSLALATGLKVARPDLTVIVASGDGDGFSIGGNHFLHACRRNADLTYIVMDNRIYGMDEGATLPDDRTRFRNGDRSRRPRHFALPSHAHRARLWHQLHRPHVFSQSCPLREDDCRSRPHAGLLVPANLESLRDVPARSA